MSNNVGQEPPSAPFWDAGYMDGPNAIATDATVVVAFPGMTSPPTSTGSFNYVASGMVVESQSHTGSNDYANFAMLYLTNTGSPFIIGEVWQTDDANPAGTPAFLWGEKWSCDCLTSTTFASILTLTMSWSGGLLGWSAYVGGAQYSLFYYTPLGPQEQVFHVGNSLNGITGIYDHFFQFGVMVPFDTYTPYPSLTAYVGNPKFIVQSASSWTTLNKARWQGTSPGELDNWYAVGRRGHDDVHSCLTGGAFPGISGGLLFGQMVIFPTGSLNPYDDRPVWDSNCAQDVYWPSASFTAATPIQGSWENGQFTVTTANSENGPIASGLAGCFWSIDSFVGGNWISTLTPQVIGCNSSQTVTVGSSGYCLAQAGSSCRVNVWSEDNLGNVGSQTLLSPSSGDAWTEGSGSGWSFSGGPATDDSTVKIVGSQSVKASWSGADLRIMSYPGNGALGSDITKMGNSPTIQFYTKTSCGSRPSNWAPPTLRITLETTSADSFGYGPINLSDSNWQFSQISVGVTGAFQKVGNADWSKINKVDFQFDFAPGVCNGSTWVDGLSFMGVSSPTSRSFSIDWTPPSTPTLSSPSNGARTMTTTPTLTWTAASDATSGVSNYVVQWDTSPSFNPSDTDLTTFPGITGTQIRLNLPISPQVWYWRVQAEDNAGNYGPWSQTWSFLDPDFTITANPLTLTFMNSRSSSSTLTISPINGFAGTISVDASPNSDPHYCSVAPNTVTLTGSGSASTTLTCSSTSADTFYATIVANVGPFLHTADILVTVNDFSVATSPSTINIPAGRADYVTVQVNSINGYSNNIVGLSVGSLPNCVTATLNPSSFFLASGATAQIYLSLAVGPGCSASTTNLYVNAWDAQGYLRSAIITLVTSEFQLSLVPNAAGFALGASGPITVGDYSTNNYPSTTLHISISGLQSCMAASWYSTNLNSPGYSTQVIITVGASCSAGTYAVTFQGQAADYVRVIRTVTFSLVVNNPPFTVLPNPAYAWSGSSVVSAQVNTGTLYGATDTLVLSAIGPTCVNSYGFGGTLAVNSGGVGTSMQIYAPSCYVGSYSITIFGDGNKYHVSTTLTLQLTGGSGGGGGSLASGTLITMADGSLKSVQNVRNGDKLLGYDTATKTYTVSVVMEMKTVTTNNLLIINTARGLPLIVDKTPTEVLWTMFPNGTKVWLPVTNLAVGDYLFTQNSWVEVTNMFYYPHGTYAMYDITATYPYFADGYLDPPHPS